MMRPIETNWRRLTNEPIDNFEKILRQDIEQYLPDYKLSIAVGCDSQVRKKKSSVAYVTAVVLHRLGAGGRVYYKQEVEPMNHIQPQRRLWNETYRSVAVAQFLDDILVDYLLEVDAVHADLNQDKKYLSNQVVNECIGYIVGMGYSGVLKPDAWVASKVADCRCR